MFGKAYSVWILLWASLLASFTRLFSKSQYGSRSIIVKDLKILTTVIEITKKEQEEIYRA
jgi:hypothetical protein